MPSLGGLRGYTVIWTGQFFSSLGANMTAFALSLWLWERTGSATALATVPFIVFLPLIFITPLVGALVDRWNQHLKRVMMIGDAARLLTSLVLLALLSSGHLALPWLYLLIFVEAALGAFQWPADSAATTVMLRQEDYARAGGIQSVVGSASTILAPVLGALLYKQVGLSGLVLLDLLGSLVALLTLVPVIVPRPPRGQARGAAPANLWHEALYGFRFILASPHLLTLQLVFLFGNLINGLTMALFTPLILARSGNNAGALATTQMAGGIGGVLVGLTIAGWGGPKRRIHGVLIGWTISMTAILVNGLAQSVWPWVLGALIGALGAPVTNSSNQAIWQSKTPADIQGKVFAARRVIAMLALPLSTLVAGPLVDRWLNPAMLPGGSLAPIFGRVVGSGPGAGISLLFVFVGLFGLLVMLGMYGVRHVRDVEQLVPDVQELPACDHSAAGLDLPAATPRPTSS
ncbi:MFS transporter [Deinococcus hopiensis]|uniref:Major Facilitator Superfamily protein n=1 Tax=Deinococcus hopiensis KR-140 TaxID=695939 RepID=A0A1W1VVC3_9DEIO|nr:MFS transporter [Deinococcus hopiensis]SMB97051.1 Major Facilitator Superfamily protein [Deinococcus hopiensis KR-140]